MTDNISGFRKPPADGKASEWTPRQALLHALAILDDEPTTRVVIILGHIDEENESVTRLVVATPDAYETIGMLTEATKASNA